MIQMFSNHPMHVLINARCALALCINTRSGMHIIYVRKWGGGEGGRSGKFCVQTVEGERGDKRARDVLDVLLE